jgi:hypothetical protein
MKGEAPNSEEDKVDMSSLQVFGPMLLQVIFDSIDKKNAPLFVQSEGGNTEDNATKSESMISPSSVQSSDLSDASDLSLLSESMEEESKKNEDDREDGVLVLNSLDTRDVSESTTMVEENNSSVGGLISVSLEDTEK